MVKKHAILNLMILLFAIFSFIKSDDDWIIYDFSTNSATRVDTGTRSFGIDFGYGDLSKIPFYFKIEVTSDDSNPAPRLCFSNKDKNCDSKNQLVKNPNGKTAVIWIKRDEINKNDQEFYIRVECAKDNCAYKLFLQGDQYPTFRPNFVYSYLVGDYNKEMRFEIEGSEKNVYLTVSLEGSSKATLTVDNVYRQTYKYKSVSVLSYPLEDTGEENRLASITVKNADVGEYLTLSVHLVNATVPLEGLAPVGFLQPNGPEITGYLELNTMNEECFPLDLSDDRYKSMSKLYVTGRIYTKYAWFFLEDENRRYLEEYDLEIVDGYLSFTMKNNGKMNYLCFELPGENVFKVYTMAFTFSVTEPNSIPSLFDYYPPQLSGEIYRRIIPKGNVAFFSAAKLDTSSKKYDYSVFRRKGLLKTYIADCRTYPDCHYEASSLGNLKSPKPTNQMTIWTNYEENSSTLGKEKNVIVVYCEDDDNENTGVCEFETSIFEKNQDIYLVEDETFSKYVVAEEKGVFVADIQSGRAIQRLTFDIMVYSGDVTFTCHDRNVNGQLREDIITSYNKYYLSNKVFFHINLAQTTTEQIVVEFKAELNSFFTIRYGIHSFNLVQLEESVASGESYLVQIDPTTSTRDKDIFLTNQFYKNKNPFLANFFALNCEFEVKRGENEITFFDGYAQEIIDSSSAEYSSESYNYHIKITESDLSNYNKKMCMLYVAGYESESKLDREIMVGENINQQIIFNNNNFKKIRFLYPHADAYKDLAIHINVIDKAFYKIKIYANDKVYKEVTVTRTQTFYVKGSVIINSCNENTICPIIVEASYDKKIINTDPMLEVTIREIKNTPTYLQKGQAKLDFVCGDRFYYLYTDIGKNEMGEVTVNFLREFGSIWAKVVKKDQTSAEDEANWRGIYRMPSADWQDSLNYNGYTKKISVNPKDTEECIEGCYLLMSVQISQIGEYVDDSKFYPFSILTRITPSSRAYTDIQKVVIQVDEFIIGNVDIADNERIYEFYEIWLPHDSKTVEFDFQSSVVGLYINLGGSRPTTKNAHFKLLPPGRQTVLKLAKEDILSKAKDLRIKLPYDNSLQDINLVIGIWTDKSDSINTELYSLRVHQPEFDSEDPLDIVLVNTDQKIMCNPKEISQGEFRCLFVVTYDDDDVNMFTPLLAYGASLNHGALSYMFANFIDRDIYDQYIINDLSGQIPTFQTSELNSRTEGVNYIYTSTLQKEKYMFINVMTDKPDPIMMVTSMPVYNYISYDLFEYYPNPTTEQLLSIPGEKLRLAFPGNDSIMVDLVCLNGHAEISWKRDPDTVYILRGVGDRISLSSGNKVDDLVIHRIVSDDDNPQNDKLNAMEDPGFVFYINYHLRDRDQEVTFEEINYGKSLEIAFKDTDLPVVLYSKIGTEYRDVNVAITFKDNNFAQSGEYLVNPLLISAQLVKEKTVYDAKKDKDINPSIERSVKGNYDTALKTAQVFLSEDKIKSYNVKEADNPTLYIRVDKFGSFEETTFNKFSVEAQVSGVNDGVIPVEKVYHYGRVRNSAWQQTFYRLRVDKIRPFMRVQIAFNSNNLDFVVSDSETNRRSNITFDKVVKARGRVSVTFKVNSSKDLYYLYIFKRTRTQNEEYLNNYAFKYINARTEADLIDFPIANSPEITISEKKENNLDLITCTFNKLDVAKESANITYFFKVVENQTHIYGEEVNTVAVTESPFYSVFVRNPEDSDGKITLTAKGILSNWAYLNVIAQIQQNNVLEYVSYNGKKNIRPSPKTSGTGSGKTSTALFLVVGGILLLIVIALVVIIFIFQQKNKALLNQVKHVSFQQTNSNSNVDPNLLLQKSQ